MKTIFGIKDIMTQTWDTHGQRLPVTVIKTPPLKVTAVKTEVKDGYPAVQVGIGTQKATRINKPLKNHLQSMADAYPRYLREIKPEATDKELQVGDVLAVGNVLTVGDQVTVTGISKGRGFAGAMKRWGFHGGPKTHGQSDRARAVGSIGQGTSPGRIHKGKKMAGHFGMAQTSLKHVTVVKIDTQKSEVWVSGPIPGAKGGLIALTVSGKTKFPGLRETQHKEDL